MAEQWIKEGKQATHWTRLSCHRFRANEARLQLNLLAYNLGNLWRRLVLPKRIDPWSLTSLQQRLVKTGGESPHAAVVWEHAAQCQSRLEKKTCLRNGFEKPNFEPWDFQVSAEKAMQSRTWLEG